MKLSFVLTLITGTLALDNSINFWKNPGCDPSAKDADYVASSLPQPNHCQRSFDNWKDWPKNADGDYIVYLNGNGIPDNCTWTLRDSMEPDTKQCGQPVLQLEQDARGTCQQAFVSSKGGDGLCCGSYEQRQTCSLDYEASSKRDLATPSHRRDVVRAHNSAHVERKSKDDTCQYHGSQPTAERGDVQVIINEVACAANSTGPCPQTQTKTVTTSSTNSFDVGVDVTTGEEFFEKIQVTVHFGYTYSYEKSNSVAIAQTVQVPAGQKGEIIWTPFLQCTTGYFTGDCKWNVKKNGTACVPIHLNNDQSDAPQGLMAFLQIEG